MTNSNQSAYPVLETEIGIEFHAGLTKREAFALAALKGLLSSDTGFTTYHNEIASRSVSLADALLKELEK